MGEKHQPSSLKAGLEIPFLTKKIKMNAGTFEEGEVIEYDYSTEKGNKCTTVEKVFGICPQNVTLEDDDYLVVYISGIFNQKALKKEGSVEWKDIEKNARPLNILFR